MCGLLPTATSPPGVSADLETRVPLGRGLIGQLLAGVGGRWGGEQLGEWPGSSNPSELLGYQAVALLQG